MALANGGSVARDGLKSPGRFSRGKLPQALLKANALSMIKTRPFLFSKFKGQLILRAAFSTRLKRADLKSRLGKLLAVQGLV